MLPFTRKPFDGLALSADREVAGIQVARGRSGRAARHDDGVGLQRTGGNHARLHGQQIGKAASVQRHRGHVLRRDQSTVLRRIGLRGQNAGGDFDDFRMLGQRELHVGAQAGGGLNVDAGVVKRLEAGYGNGHLVGPRRDIGEGIRAVGSRLRVQPRAGSEISQYDVGAGYNGPARIGDGAGDLSAVGGESVVGEESEGEHKKQEPGSAMKQTGHHDCTFEIRLGATVYEIENRFQYQANAQRPLLL